MQCQAISPSMVERMWLTKERMLTHLTARNTIPSSIAMHLTRSIFAAALTILLLTLLLLLPMLLYNSRQHNENIIFPATDWFATGSYPNLRNVDVRTTQHGPASKLRCDNVLVRVLESTETPDDPFSRSQRTPKPRHSLDHLRPKERPTLAVSKFRACRKAMSINSWCSIQKNRHLTQNLSCFLCTDSTKFYILCQPSQPWQTKPTLNISSVLWEKLRINVHTHFPNISGNIFCISS